MKPAIYILFVALFLVFVYAQDGCNIATISNSNQLSAKIGNGAGDRHMKRVPDDASIDKDPTKKQDSPYSKEQQVFEKDSDGDKLKGEETGNTGDDHKGSDRNEQGHGGHSHKGHKSMFISPALLTTNPTLIIIATILTAFAWCSGYIINFLIDRQEQMAYSVAVSKKRQEEDSSSVEEFDLRLFDRNADVRL